MHLYMAIVRILLCAKTILDKECFRVTAVEFHPKYVDLIARQFRLTEVLILDEDFSPNI